MPSLSDDFVEGSFANEFFTVDADDRGAGSFAGPAENRGEAAGKKMLDEANPGGGVVHERAAGFDENRFAGEPQVGGACRDDSAFLKDLAGEQFGVEAALVHDAGFAGGGFTEKKDNRESGELGAGAEAGSGDLGGGFANENVDVVGSGSA